MDLLFLSQKSGLLDLMVYGKTSNLDLLLYQKVIIITLTDNTLLFRLDYGTLLMGYVGKSNMMPLTLLDSLLALIKNQVFECLLTLDSLKIQDIKLSYSDNNLYMTIILKNGSTYTGALN